MKSVPGGDTSPGTFERLLGQIRFLYKRGQTKWNNIFLFSGTSQTSVINGANIATSFRRITAKNWILWPGGRCRMPFITAWISGSCWNWWSSTIFPFFQLFQCSQRSLIRKVILPRRHDPKPQRTTFAGHSCSRYQLYLWIFRISSSEAAGFACGNTSQNFRTFSGSGSYTHFHLRIIVHHILDSAP